MANVEIGIRIQGAADKVWAIIAGPDMKTVIQKVYAENAEFQGQGVGSVLTTTLKNGQGVVKERIEYINEEDRCLRYRVIDNGPWPYTDYSGEMKVIPSGPDKCSISFRCSFIPVGEGENASRKFWLAHNTEVIQQLEEFAKR